MLDLYQFWEGAASETSHNGPEMTRYTIHAHRLMDDLINNLADENVGADTKPHFSRSISLVNFLASLSAPCNVDLWDDTGDPEAQAHDIVLTSFVAVTEIVYHRISIGSSHLKEMTDDAYQDMSRRLEFTIDELTNFRPKSNNVENSEYENKLIVYWTKMINKLELLRSQIENHIN